MDPTRHRIEHDSMGEVAVPADALWGAQTQRAVHNFPISGIRVDAAVIVALARIKGRAALVNASLRSQPAVDGRVGRAIADAADEIVAGEHLDQFPVDVFQTGSGTSTNMNMNEVLARLASARLGTSGEVHPNDQVNASQSSNDVFPTAIHLAVAATVAERTVPGLEHLAASFRTQARRWSGAVKAGRTHLMDATPVTFGQVFGGYATQLEQAAARLSGSLERVCEVPLGGTAVGTGLNAPAAFAPKVLAALAEDTGLPLREADDHFAHHGARDALVDVSGLLRVAAVALTKIANDIRFMGSGPTAGLAEVRLPDLQPGSSIMPAKVNPVLCESVTQVAVQVIGNDATVAAAGSSGHFELNVYLPVMARNLLEAATFLGSVTTVFAERCVDGIEVNTERSRAYAEGSPAVATGLNPELGYEKVAELIKRSSTTGEPVRDLVLRDGLLDEQRLEELLDVDDLTGQRRRRRR
ncbi:MAG: class II fumarate hydratase [Acidimicrobiia bacterium]|nr:class II fumarate hydratase [Acidimicrobiia bacterium]